MKIWDSKQNWIRNTFWLESNLFEASEHARMTYFSTWSGLQTKFLTF